MDMVRVFICTTDGVDVREDDLHQILADSPLQIESFRKVLDWYHETATVGSMLRISRYIIIQKL